MVNASREQAFNLRRYEARYRTAGRYLEAALPPNAAIIAVQHSASARHYTGAPVVRWDPLPVDLDAAVAALRKLGQHPFILVEDWEEAALAAKFPRSRLARLDWAPRADFGELHASDFSTRPTARHADQSADGPGPLARHRRLLLEFGIRLQNQLPEPVLRRGVRERPEQRERAALAVDRVLARRERDVAAAAGSALPDGEADQLQAFERPSVKCNSASANFPGGLFLPFGVILTTTAPSGHQGRQGSGRGEEGRCVEASACAESGWSGPGRRLERPAAKCELASQRRFEH